MNPQAPRLKAKIKMHKPLAPISGTPTYKIAKHIPQGCKDLINLKFESNIMNTMQFVENIFELRPIPEHKLMTMNIKDLYVKIPINYTLYIANKLLNNNCVNEHITRTSCKS